MKRKVAVGGRPNREFSWSMSVEPGERCYRKHKRRKRAPESQCDFAVLENPGFCSGRFLCGNVQNKFRVFSGQQRNARHGVVGNATLAKRGLRTDPYLLLYGLPQTSEILIRRQKQWQ